MGVTKTHSRPYTSDDNPFSESQFKTLKYRPEFPDRFGSIEDSRSFCRVFFAWYNTEHHHCGIGLLTPKSVHYGLAKSVQEAEPQCSVRHIKHILPGIWISFISFSNPHDRTGNAFIFRIGLKGKPRRFFHMIPSPQSSNSSEDDKTG